jgi:hypothetical protein
METIKSSGELKIAIETLSLEQAVKEKLLKEQFHLAFESIKPANLLKGTLKDVASSPLIIEDIIGTVLGLSTGYLSKKIIVGSSANVIRKIIGSVMQVSISKLVANNVEGIKSAGWNILHMVFKKKKSNTDSK